MKTKRGILGNCPNLEALKVEADKEEILPNLLPFMTCYNPKLKVMKILSNAALGSEYKFKYLESLKLAHVQDNEALANFLKSLDC
jgi:hypothetical protein